MMIRSLCVAMMLLAASPAWAQPAQPPVTPVPSQAPPPRDTPPPGRQTPPRTVTPVAQAPSEAPPRRVRGRDVNLQIELTITDQAGSGTPDKKVVSMLAADGTFGRIRSISNLGASINVDARPQILDSGGILLELTIEYGPPSKEGASGRERPAVLNESLSVILQPGKPQMISEASDPVLDRKMTVEVRAAILK